MAGAVLPVVALAELDAGDLGNGIGLVGGFQRAGEQGIFGHGLRRELGVDAAAAQEQQFLHAGSKGRVNHIGLDHQVLVDELGRVGVVGVNAAHLGCGQVHLVGLFCGKEGAHSGLIGQVQLSVHSRDDGVGRMPMRQQMAHDGRTHHAPVACDVNFGSGSHVCVA